MEAMKFQSCVSKVHSGSAKWGVGVVLTFMYRILLCVVHLCLGCVIEAPAPHMTGSPMCLKAKAWLVAGQTQFKDAFWGM